MTQAAGALHEREVQAVVLERASGEYWLLCAGETPGTSSARSRTLRPFIGSAVTAACEIVPAIWLRAASRTTASALTVTLASSELSASAIGSSKAEPAV